MEFNNEEYNFTSKWSRDVSEYGFTQIPNILLTCQGHLDISDAELVTYIQLQKFWFSANSSVFPSITTLAKYSNNGYSTVQRRLKNLEQKGFIKRIHRFGTSNTFDLKPGVQKVHEHQLTCTPTPHLRAEQSSDFMEWLTSKHSKKEYEAQRKTDLNDTSTNVSASGFPADTGDTPSWMF